MSNATHVPPSARSPSCGGVLPHTLQTSCSSPHATLPGPRCNCTGDLLGAFWPGFMLCYSSDCLLSEPQTPHLRPDELLIRGSSQASPLPIDQVVVLKAYFPIVASSTPYLRGEVKKDIKRARKEGCVFWKLRF